MTGKNFLKSNVTIDISPEATLLAAPGPIYAEPKGSIESLIYGDQLENITIKGGGVIEGKTGITRERGKGFGRRLVGLERCKKVTISNITITHGGGITVLLHSIDDLEMDRVKVLSFLNIDPDGGEGKDALNLDGCKNVWIHDCEFRGSDDAFALKARGSMGFQTTSENIIIERCTFASRTCNAIQFGSETNADFRNIRISDCVIEHAGKAGIGITMNDGHIIENIVYKNVTMRNVCTPFYIGILARNGIGKIQNVTFEDIVADVFANIENPESKSSPIGYWVSAINGIKNAPISDITFRNITLQYKGGLKINAENILPPDPPEDYQPRKLGIRPASGFYVRHARNILFQNLKVTLENPDMRPTIVLDYSEKVTFNNLKFPVNNYINYDILLIQTNSIKADDEKIVIKNKEQVKK